MQRTSHTAFHSSIKPHKTASVTGISNTRRTETLCKSCWRDPGEISTWVLCYLGWPANPKLSNIRTTARLLPRKSHQRRSAAELTKTMSAVQKTIACWTDDVGAYKLVNGHVVAATTKAAPRSCRCLCKGQTCSHLQSLHTCSEGTLLLPLFPLVPVVDLTTQRVCIQALSHAAGHCIITTPCKSSTQPGQKLSLVLPEWNLQTW